jgi:transposase
MRDLLVLKEALLPKVAGMVLDHFTEADGLIVVEAHCDVRELACPDCSAVSRRVHSRYERHLTELPVGGRRVVVRLTVRRFFCDAPDCPRRTFVEQVPGLTSRYARAGPMVRVLWRAVAFALGGRLGARLCRILAMPTGRGRLPGLLQAPPVPARSPRVLGIDDFAFRRGHTYGTLLVDVEKSVVLDVLPDRDVATVADWLVEHPGAEVICRDRASAYSKAIKHGAPDAQEVADRWHLLKNLSQAVESICRQHRACLQKHAESTAEPTPPKIMLPMAPPQTRLVERTHHWYVEIHQLLDQGWTRAAIARYLNVDWRTVNRYTRTDLESLLSSARNRRPNSVLAPFKPYINSRVATTDEPLSASQLFQEIRERGYRGSSRSVQRYLATVHSGAAEPDSVPIPSPRTISSWIMRRRETLTHDEETGLLQVRLSCQDLASTCDFARAFHDLAIHGRGAQLTEWIRQAEQQAPQPMQTFAGYLRQDLDAVTAGLTLPYSSGVVEGHVNLLMTLSSRSSGGDCRVIASSVTDQRPQDVHPSTSQSEDGLGMPLTFGAFAFIEVPRGAAGTDADERGRVEDALQSAVITARAMQIAADSAGVTRDGRNPGEAGQSIRSAVAAEVAGRGGQELCPQQRADAGHAADDLGEVVRSKLGLDALVDLGDLRVEVLDLLSQGVNHLGDDAFSR